MRSNASPLTVWVGSIRYVFPPGRDIFVGRGEQCDIRLDRPGTDEPDTVRAPVPDLLLRFTGTDWVAIDRSRYGIFVAGTRMSTVDIHDGQAITIGDPQHGPQLIFQLSTPPGRRPGPVSKRAQPTLERPTKPLRLPTPPAVPATASAPAPGAEPGEVASPTNRLPLKSGARTIGVAAYQLGLTRDGHELLSNVSLTASRGSMIAVIGPSAARNSVLIETLGGIRKISSGVLTVDGHDVYAEPDSMRSRIGVVPRDNRVHAELTVERALDHTARLRLPPSTSPDDRRRVVNQISDELELTEYRKSRITTLPPEVRRCVSLAIELVTRPSLLVVDRASPGLDPAQEGHVMAMLRRQADLGCVVAVATASLDHLNLCDQVVLLTPTGALAFAGPPVQIESAMGTSSWSDVLARVAADPSGAHRDFLARQPAVPAPPSVATPEPRPAERTLGQQIRWVTRRQTHLFFSDRFHLPFLAVLPFALAGLILLIPGGSGFDRADPSSNNPHEAVEILAALNLAAVILGFALTVRDLVGERRIFRREQDVGLSATAYLAGKIAFFGGVATIQAAILTALVVGVKGAPVHGAVVLPNPAVELYVSVAATAIVSAIVGLALSTLGRSLWEVLPLVLPAILASLLFAGGLVRLAGTWGFDQISWIVPAHWGFAASASTVDLRRVDKLAAHIGSWTHYVGWWMFDMVMLAVLGAMWAGFVRYRLRPLSRHPYS